MANSSMQKYLMHFPKLNLYLRKTENVQILRNMLPSVQGFQMSYIELESNDRK